MSSQLSSRDFLEIMIEYLESHGQITIDHDYDLYSEAIKCLRREADSNESTLMCDSLVEEPLEQGGTLASMKESFGTLSGSEQEEFLEGVLNEKSKGIIKIPLEMVRNCYMKEVGENCGEEMLQKIASQVARDFDFHKSVHKQVLEACKSAEDPNMLALLSI